MDFVTSVALALLVLVLSRAALGIAHSHKFFPDKIIVRQYEKLRHRVAKLVAKSRVEEKPPAINNAPGLTWKRLKAGWLAQWCAPREAVQRGWVPKSIRLWCGEKAALTPNIEGYIQERARDFQNELNAWMSLRSKEDGREPSMEAILASIRRIIADDAPNSATK